MKTIWKYPLKVTDLQDIDMPDEAVVLCVQTQHDQPCLWVLVGNKVPLCSRRFRIIGTGITLSDGESRSYVGTFQVNGGALVFHVFEVTS